MGVGVGAGVRSRVRVRVRVRVRARAKVRARASLRHGAPRRCSLTHHPKPNHGSTVGAANLPTTLSLTMAAP